MPPENVDGDVPVTALTFNPTAVQDRGEQAIAYGSKVQELADLRAKIQEGLDDIAAGRVSDFDAERIIAKGSEQLHES